MVSSSQLAVIEPIELPAAFTAQWAMELGLRLDAATRQRVPLKQVLPPEAAEALFAAATRLLLKEPTLLEVTPSSPTATVTVVGDTHGQLHDVIGPLAEAAGWPSEEQLFVWNGDFVDRGAWGVELLAVLAAWKLALPSAVFLLRGNHESITCTKMYGFFQELQAKYGKVKCKLVFKACKRLFAALPLAACIASKVLVLHGGLFRKPDAVAKSKKRRRKPVSAAMDDAVVLGSLADLRAASKGGMDPSGQGSTLVAADVMWSDPSGEPGLRPNDARGVGVVFGADITEHFLQHNGLRLVIRSHEGPDARVDRNDMPPMTPGYSTDHVTESGKLMTVFSAPDYPQFQLPGERYDNLGAVLRLSPPNYTDPVALQFSASLPRPEADCFYDLGVPDSDEEIELGGYASEVSGVSSLGGSAMSGGSGDDEVGAAQAADAASSPMPDGGLGRPAKAAREDKAPKVPAPAAPADLMALEDELLARAVAGDSDASSNAEAAVLEAGAALLGTPSTAAAGSQDSGSSGPAMRPVPAAAAPAAQLVLEGALLRGESGTTAVLDQMQADAEAADVLHPKAASAPAAQPAGAPGHAPACSGARSLSGGAAAAATAAAAEAAHHASAVALATDRSMPQALSSSVAAAPQLAAGSAPLSAPLTASMPQAASLAEQNSTAGTAAFASALTAETEGLAAPGTAAAAAPGTAAAAAVADSAGAAADGSSGQQLEQLVGGSRKQTLPPRPARRSSAMGQQGNGNSVAKKPWK